MANPAKGSHRTCKNANAANDNAELVIVPRNDRSLVPISPERIRRLRKHLAKLLRELPIMKEPACSASLQQPQLTGVAARVAHAACSLCKGWCCPNGGDDAFLDDQTVARVRRERSGLDARTVIRLYSERVPALVYRDSCIFHGGSGCTLDRALRADICNAYFCGGLSAFVKGGGEGVPTTIIAGEGDAMQTSPVLIPE